MAKKYYAVKKGVVPGIYRTWAECKQNIDGFSGAVYRGFPTLEEAEAFLGKTEGGGRRTETNGVPAADVPAAVGIAFQDGETDVPADRAVAYVDGSYNAATKEYAYGAVIFYGGEELHFSEKGADASRAKMRNVAGEIEGSMCAMRYCLEHGILGLDIYFDYEGIERWCTGEWKANKEGTIAYRKFYQEAKKQVDIRFVKVKGHSGDTYNDLADRLAKQALGLDPVDG